MRRLLSPYVRTPAYLFLVATSSSLRATLTLRKWWSHRLVTPVTLSTTTATPCQLSEVNHTRGFLLTRPFESCRNRFLFSAGSFLARTWFIETVVRPSGRRSAAWKVRKDLPVSHRQRKEKEKNYTEKSATAAGAKISQMDGHTIKKKGAQLVATMHELGGVTSQMLISIGIRTQGHDRQTGHVSTNLSTGKVKRKKEKPV